MGFKDEQPRSRIAAFQRRPKRQISNPLGGAAVRPRTEQRLGTRALANQLNAEGPRTARGGLWSGASIQAVLQNPVYIGEIRWRQERHAAPHQHLVAREVFDDAQTLIDSRSKNRSLRRSNSSGYLLSGKLRCSHCGAAMVGSAANGRSRRYRYYTCFNRHRYGKTNGCTAERIPADALEQQLLQLIADTLADNSVLTRAVARAAELADGQRPTLQSEMRTVVRELGKLAETRDRYLAAFERGTLPEDACATRLRALEDQAAQLQGRHTDLVDALAAAEPAPLDNGAISALHTLLIEGLPDAGPSERKHIVGQLIETIEVRGRDWIKPTLRVPTVRILDGEVGQFQKVESVPNSLQTEFSR